MYYIIYLGTLDMDRSARYLDTKIDVVKSTTKVL